MLTVLINFHIVQLRNVGEVKLMQEVDLRSDTVTHPSPEMRDAIANAKIGDDVFSDDPSVNRLEEMAANAMGRKPRCMLPVEPWVIWFLYWHTRAEAKRLFLEIKLIFFDLKVEAQLL